MKSSLFAAAALTGFLSGGNLFAEAPAAAHDHAMDKGKCSGVNACKGQGMCGTATHDCAGKNECKGKGWLKKTAEECKAAGGTFESTEHKMDKKQDVKKEKKKS